jgi:hypothetical protein
LNDIVSGALWFRAVSPSTLYRVSGRSVERVG